ncbi:MAG TPA: tetratricopeptide repeat protein, partial [Blastocatellia bacterium]
MKIRFAISMLMILSLCAMQIQAQQPAQEKPKDEKAEEKKPQPPPRPQPPPEYMAFSRANQISDPEKRIEALEKVLADFPKAEPFVISMIHQAIFSSVVKAWPDQKDKILAQAQKYLDATPENNRGSAYNSVASILLGAGIMLDEARGFIEKGLASLDEKKYIESQKKMYESAKRPAPKDEELAKGFRSMRAGYTSVLGRILLKKGQIAEAEKLLKESYEANPTNTATAVALAEVAEKAGNINAALDYLATAVLSGRPSREDRKKFEELYSKTHNNSMNGVEAFLDERYAKAFPEPMHAEHYKPTASRSSRVVLAEVFTGSGCPPCVAADLAFEAMMERYSRNEVAVLMYHQHIPLPDPMTNPATQNRFKFYQGGGVPTYVIDGKKDSGGGPRDATRQFYDRVNPFIEKELETAAEADLKLEAAFDGTTIKVKAMVENVKSEGEVKLQ